MLLRDFSGGLNTRVHPSLLQPNEAQEYTNIDGSSGAIIPVKDKALHTSSINRYFTWYYANSEFISSSTEASYIEYKDILYSTRLNDYPTKYDGTNTYSLGIIGPGRSPTVSLNGSGVLEGTYTYLYTYYNSTDGTESQGSTLSTEVIASLNTIDVSIPTASTDPQVTNIRLYRIGGALSSYTLVISLSNSVQTYSDNIADIDIAGNHIYDSALYKEAPIGLKYITEAYGMLFGVVDDKLYYSEIAKPNAWPSTYFIDFPETIMGIGEVQNGLLVFTKYKTYIITGNNPLSFTKYLLDGSQGCLSHYTIQFVNNTLLWLSTDGICASSGGIVEVISLPKVGKISFTSINNAQVLDNVYYLAADGKIFCYDFRYNKIIRVIDNSVDWLGSYNDTLYANFSNDIYEMMQGSPLTYKWKSPILTEGEYSNYKLFKEFYIRYNGDITFKLYVDGALVNIKQLSGNTCYNLKALDSARGYGLEIELEGTGEVYEISYKVTGRQK